MLVDVQEIGASIQTHPTLGAPMSMERDKKKGRLHWRSTLGAPPYEGRLQGGLEKGLQREECLERGAKGGALEKGLQAPPPPPPGSFSQVFDAMKCTFLVQLVPAA